MVCCVCCGLWEYSKEGDRMKKFEHLKGKVKEEMKLITELWKEGKVDEKTSKELRCRLGQIGYMIVDIEEDVKSAVQGLEEDLAVATNRDFAKELIKKWFPDVLDGGDKE